MRARSRLTRLKARVSTPPPKSRARTRIGGGSPIVRTRLPRLWSKRAMPGSIMPSLGSTRRAIWAMSAGGIGADRAAAVAAIAAATSAVLLAMPLPRGRGLCRQRRASRSQRPKWARVRATARRALGADAGARMLPPPGASSTDAFERISMGQLTRKYSPRSMPWASSPQLPGAYAVALRIIGDPPLCPSARLGASRGASPAWGRLGRRRGARLGR